MPRQSKEDVGVDEERSTRGDGKGMMDKNPKREQRQRGRGDDVEEDEEHLAHLKGGKG